METNEGYLINFKNIQWEAPAKGIRFKAYLRDNQKIRLVEFTEEFEEKNWCISGHIGYVLEGKISIDFNSKVVDFKAGDGIYIPEGEEHKHKGKIAKNEKALLILFERV